MINREENNSEINSLNHLFTYGIFIKKKFKKEHIYIYHSFLFIGIDMQAIRSFLILVNCISNVLINTPHLQATSFFCRLWAPVAKMAHRVNSPGTEAMCIVRPTLRSRSSSSNSSSISNSSC